MAQSNIKKTTKQFIKEAQSVHGDRYKYDEAEYKGNKIPLTIICPIHGRFQQTPIRHLMGRGCQECGKHRSMKGKQQVLSQEEFIKRCIIKYGHKYDFSITTYNGMHNEIEVICPIHGVFKREAYSFLHGTGCPECIKSKSVKTTEEFIAEANRIHNHYFDYTNTIYTNGQSEIVYTCPIHGEIKQRATNHLKYGCPQCTYDKYKLTQEEYIQRAKSVHKEDFDYSNSIYRGMEKPINIICHKKDRFGNEHGEFTTIARDHIYKKYGCPKCIETYLEQEIRHMLDDSNIEYVQHYHESWLLRKSLDFYLPQYNVAVECQGIQHFKPVEWFGGIKSFEKQIQNDKLKRQLCEEHGIKLLYYSNLGIDYPYKVFEDKEELLLEILNS